MRTNKFFYAWRATLSLLVLLASVSGRMGAREATPQASASARLTSALNIEDSLIKFAMDRAGRAQVAVKQPGRHELVLAPAGSAFFTLTTQSGERFGMQLDWARVREELLQNEMGDGNRKRIPGVARAGYFHRGSGVCTSTITTTFRVGHDPIAGLACLPQQRDPSRLGRWR